MVKITLDWIVEIASDRLINLLERTQSLREFKFEVAGLRRSYRNRKAHELKM
jgi:hypothetical protein